MNTERIITIVGVIILFAVGVLTLAGNLVFGELVYKVPTDGTMVVVLIGSLVAVIALTVITGFGLARAFGLLSHQVKAKHDPEERPEIEKRALAALDKGGEVARQALARFGYGDSEVVKPYTPDYSYKAQAEEAETRQFTRWIVVVIGLLVLWSARTHWDQWIAEIQEFSSLQWYVAAGSAVGIVVLTLATGAGLGFWFYRTHQEQDKIAPKK